MSNGDLLRPYERADYHGMITPTDVYLWTAQEHDETAWQARERVLRDQLTDAVEEHRLDRVLMRVGIGALAGFGTLSVLLFGLVVDEALGDMEGPEPVWALIVGLVAAFVAVAGLVAAWHGLADGRGSRVQARVAERAMREHEIAYAAT